MNKIISRYNNLLKNNPNLKDKDLLAQKIKALDEQANNKLSKRHGFIRKLTSLRRFFSKGSKEALQTLSPSEPLREKTAHFYPESSRRSSDPGREKTDKKEEEHDSAIFISSSNQGVEESETADFQHPFEGDSAPLDDLMKVAHDSTSEQPEEELSLSGKSAVECQKKPLLDAETLLEKFYTTEDQQALEDQQAFQEEVDARCKEDPGFIKELVKAYGRWNGFIEKVLIKQIKIYVANLAPPQNLLHITQERGIYNLNEESCFKERDFFAKVRGIGLDSEDLPSDKNGFPESKYWLLEEAEKSPSAAHYAGVLAGYSYFYFSTLFLKEGFIDFLLSPFSSELQKFSYLVNLPIVRLSRDDQKAAQLIHEKLSELAEKIAQGGLERISEEEKQQDKKFEERKIAFLKAYPACLLVEELFPPTTFEEKLVSLSQLATLSSEVSKLPVEKIVDRVDSIHSDKKVELSKFVVEELYRHKPLVKKHAERLYQDFSADEKAEAFSRAILDSCEEKTIKTWQGELLEKGSDEARLLWFAKLQRFYLEDRSDKTKRLLTHFFQELPKEKSSSIINSMHPAVDKLFLTSEIWREAICRQLISLLEKGQVKGTVLERAQKFADYLDFVKDREIESLNTLQTLIRQERNLLISHPNELTAVIEELKKEKKHLKKSESPAAASIHHAALDFFKNLGDHNLGEGASLRIPQYTHSTKKEGLRSILEQKKIEVRQEKLNKGAWTSTKRESLYGKYCISMTKGIHEFAKTEKPGVFQQGTSSEGFYYWVGFQEEIKLFFENKSYISHISVPKYEVEKIERLIKEQELEIPVLAHETSDLIHAVAAKYFGLELPEESF